MFKYLPKSWPVWLILVVSAVVHFAYFGYPNQTVFDEVHFGKFITGYFTGEYFFDIHPPLAKLLMSLAGYWGGFRAGFSFSNIGEAFPDHSYLALRLLPTLAGVFLPLIIYWLARRLKLSTLAATGIGLLVAIDGALLVQSRFMLLDAFLLLFGFAALLSYLRYRENRHLGNLVLTGLLAGLAGSVKWTGFSFLGIILIWELISLITHYREFLQRILKPVIITALAGLVYFATFSIHFALLPKSGQGDAFMTPEFQAGLVGSTYEKDPTLKRLGRWDKFVQLNTEMYRANQNLTATHPYGSQWYTWPWLGRSIYYWNQNFGANQEGRIYLLGNPVVWWSSSIAMLWLLLYLLSHWWSRTSVDSATNLIAGGYLFNLLPFIGITRVMFLYHYFSALIFALLALGFGLDRLSEKNKKASWAGILILATLAFFYFAPLTYGLKRTTPQLDQLFWFSSWR